MTVNEKTYIAYSCPECGAGVIAEIRPANLGSEGVQVKCSCGGSILSVEMGRDGNVRLWVPCIICPKPHPYQLSGSNFFQRELFIIQCAYSAIDILFIGKYNKVREALEKSAEEISSLISEFNDKLREEHKSVNSEQLYADPVLTGKAMYIIKELAEDKRISCSCGCTPKVSVGYDFVKFSCSCGKERSFSTRTESDIDYLNEMSEIQL